LAALRDVLFFGVEWRVNLTISDHEFTEMRQQVAGCGNVLRNALPFLAIVS
jgi:hypothetical protein